MTDEESHVGDLPDGNKTDVAETVPEGNRTETVENVPNDQTPTPPPRPNRGRRLDKFWFYSLYSLGGDVGEPEYLDMQRWSMINQYDENERTDELSVGTNSVDELIATWSQRNEEDIAGNEMDITKNKTVSIANETVSIANETVSIANDKGATGNENKVTILMDDERGYPKSRKLQADDGDPEKPKRGIKCLCYAFNCCSIN